MDKIKRVISLLLMGFIFMNHFIPLLHSIEHDRDDFISISSSTLEFEQNTNSNTHSCFFDIFINLDYSQFQSLTYPIGAANYNSSYILGKEKQFIATVLFRKKSRSPPAFFA